MEGVSGLARRWVDGGDGVRMMKLHLVDEGNCEGSRVVSLSIRIGLIWNTMDISYSRLISSQFMRKQGTFFDNVQFDPLHSQRIGAVRVCPVHPATAKSAVDSVPCQ